MGVGGGGGVEGGVSEGVGRCGWCEGPAETKCTGCRAVYYCSKECQKKGWPGHKDNCRPFTITKCPEAGRVLVASRDLDVDDLVLTDAPLVLGPRQDTEPLCLGCYRRLSGDYRCSRCRWPLCGAKCEVSPDHQPECEVARAAGVTVPMDAPAANPYYQVVMALRCLVTTKKDPKRWRSWCDRVNARYMAAVAASGGPQQHCLEHYHTLTILRDTFQVHKFTEASEAAIYSVLGVVQVNQVPTKLPYNEVTAIYPTASLLTHSCMPNTKLVFQDGKLHVRASDPIKRGETITAIYTDILWGTRARRDHLRQSRLLTCSCRRCADPTELGTYFSALVCRRCGQVVLPTVPLDDQEPWTCSGCSHQMSVDEVMRTSLALGAAVEVALASPSIPTLEALQKEWLTRVHLTTTTYMPSSTPSSSSMAGPRRRLKTTNETRHTGKKSLKKKKACKEFLTVCSRLDPSTAQTIPFVGLTFYEYHKTILQNAQRHFAQNKLTTQQLKKRMLLSKALLKKTMEIFKNEAEDTPEEQLYKTCEEEVIRIGKWMLAVGLV